jgi:hypothetical protein
VVSAVVAAKAPECEEGYGDTVRANEETLGDSLRLCPTRLEELLRAAEFLLVGLSIVINKRAVQKNRRVFGNWSEQSFMRFGIRAPIVDPPGMDEYFV